MIHKCPKCGHTWQYVTEGAPTVKPKPKEPAPTPKRDYDKHPPLGAEMERGLSITGNACRQCGMLTIQRLGGCERCVSCGWEAGCG